MYKEKCRHPERLKGRKPGECSEEQKNKCHGDEKEHCCEEKKNKGCCH